jgi:hypothetical protein
MKRSVLVGARFAVVVFAFFLCGEVVAVTVVTAVVLESAVAEVSFFILVVAVGAWLVVINGAFSWAVTHQSSFVFDTGAFHVTVASVVTLLKVNVALRSVSNKFFPSRVELSDAVKPVVETVAKETVSFVGFHDRVSVFVLHREATVDRLSCFVVLVVRDEREVFIVELNPVGTVFQSS